MQNKECERPACISSGLKIYATKRYNLTRDDGAGNAVTCGMAKPNVCVYEGVKPYRNNWLALSANDTRTIEQALQNGASGIKYSEESDFVWLGLITMGIGVFINWIHITEA